MASALVWVAILMFCIAAPLGAAYVLDIVLTGGEWTNKLFGMRNLRFMRLKFNLWLPVGGEPTKINGAEIIGEFTQLTPTGQQTVRRCNLYNGRQLIKTVDDIPDLGQPITAFALFKSAVLNLRNDDASRTKRELERMANRVLTLQTEKKMAYNYSHDFMRDEAEVWAAVKKSIGPTYVMPSKDGAGQVDIGAKTTREQ